MTEETSLSSAADLFHGTRGPKDGAALRVDGGAQSAETGVLTAAGGREAGERRLAYRRLDATRPLRLPRSGASEALTERLELAAGDALDRDRRVLFLVSRSEDRAPARRLALDLGAARAWERVESAAGLASLKVAEILEEIDAVPAEASDEGERAFVCTLSSTSLDTPLVSAFLDEAEGEPADDRDRLSAQLAARRARLVVLVVAETGQSVMRFLDALPTAVTLPWTDAWLAEFAARRRLVENELQRAVGTALREAARVDDASSAEREAVLHVLLRRLEGRDDVIGHDLVVREIEKIVGDSSHGMASLGVEARDRFLAIVRSDENPAWCGPIARTILFVALLVPDRPHHAVLEFCRRLLPPGPAHSSCLTPLLRETWLREAEDDRRLGAPVRPPPGWAALFDAERDLVTQEIGLVVGPERNLVPGQRLAGFDPMAGLREQRGRLTELARLTLSAASVEILPAGLVPVAVDLALALHRLDGGYLSRDDLVALFTGMTDGDDDLAPPRADLVRILHGFGDDLVARIRVVGDLGRLHREIDDGVRDALSDALDEDEKDRLAEARAARARVVEQSEDDLRLAAVSRLHAVLTCCFAHPGTDEASFADLLGDILRRISRRSALTVLAYLVLFGPRPAPDVLGRATLRLFEDLTRIDFTEAFRQFKDVVGRMLRSAVPVDEARPAPVDLWADALWAVADEPAFRSHAPALAIWLDDFLSTWEIPTSAREMSEIAPPAGLLSRLAIRAGDPGPDAPDEAPDLLGRLFLRTPTERLDALSLLAHRAGGPAGASAPALRVEDQIAQRLSDVFCILLGEIDPEEASRRRLDIGHFETLIWGTLSRAYGLSGVFGGATAVRAIVSHTPPRPGLERGDPRALLDLYAPAVLVFWRFDRFDTRALRPGEADYEALRATLARLDATIAAPADRRRVRRAVRALVEVETRLVDHFRSSRCPRTEARHARRLACWKAVADFFDPPTTALVPTR